MRKRTENSHDKHLEKISIRTDPRNNSTFRIKEIVISIFLSLNGVMLMYFGYIALSFKTVKSDFIKYIPFVLGAWLIYSSLKRIARLLREKSDE